MTEHGYYSHPTIHDNAVIFVSEGDLWRLDNALVEDTKESSHLNRVARRLTQNKGLIKTPVFSPDGKRVAFSSSNEGHSELYIMNANGGPLTRLTYLGDDVTVLSWTKKGIFFSSSYGQPFQKVNLVWRIDEAGGIPEKLPIGPANYISFQKDDLSSGAVIQRHGYREYGYWKRYRGGTAGDLWVDNRGSENFQKLVDLKGDMARPLWVASDKIIFSSDHEGVGNLYSSTPSGESVKRLTNHKDFYVRNQASDGKSVVYQAGADLYVLDIASETTKKIEFAYYSDRQQRSRKQFSPARFLQGYDLHPKGSHLSVVTRGKACSFGAFEGPIIQFGEKEGIRYRLPQWLHDGKRIVVISDDAGEETLEVYDAKTAKCISKPETQLDIGRVLSLHVSPKHDDVIIFNHRSEILHVDLTTWTLTKIAKSEYQRPAGGDWAPDGKWFTYSSSLNRQKMAIHLWNRETDQSQQITNPVLIDESPVFDPAGTFLYFLSHRHYDPVYDAMHFEQAFVYGTKIMALTLDPETDNPFVKLPKDFESSASDDTDGDSDAEDHVDDEDSDADSDSDNESNNDSSDSKGASVDSADTSKAESQSEQDQKKDQKNRKDKDDVIVKVNFDNIYDRILEFPIEAGDYTNLVSTKGRIYYLSHPVQGAFEASDNGKYAHTSLEVFEFETLKTDSLTTGVHCLSSNLEKSYLITRKKKALRIFKAGTKPCDDPGYSKKTGRVDLGRVNLMVTPAAEWHQMYKEAWRLQRDHYWVEDMAQIDWQLVFDRYLPLVDRASTREEFTDIVWEMQGELGTSHAYSYGGDLKQTPSWNVGSLGCDFEWDETKKAYKITNIMKGDIGSPEASSPLIGTGINLHEGDYVFAINREQLTKSYTPYEALLNKADELVELEVSPYKKDSDNDKATKKAEKKDSQTNTEDNIKENSRVVYVHALSHLYPLNYRDWVENNRRYVAEKTNGRVGYIHIPDMSTWGFAEFHRSFLQEVDKDGLIVDVRFNGGGNVSQLLLEKLARRRLGYDVTRWNGMAPYPDQAPMGSMVALTNEYAGSDGDMFSHNFKTMKLGPLIGKRTWGGVIGIWPRHGLIDGGITTQPEFSFWFKDIGWDIENYGVDPDIVVEITPQDYAKGKDPQMDRGLKELESIMAQSREDYPTLDTRPSLALPKKLA